MGIFDKYSPVAVFLSEVMRCEDCEFPCRLKEEASMASCQRHLDKLVKDGKIHITVTWRKDITLKRRQDNE